MSAHDYEEIIRLVERLTTTQRVSLHRHLNTIMYGLSRIDLDAVRWANARGVSFAELRGRSHTRAITAHRHALMAHLRDAGHSLPDIGTTLDRHHSAVLYGVQAHRARVAKGGSRAA